VLIANIEMSTLLAKKLPLFKVAVTEMVPALSLVFNLVPVNTTDGFGFDTMGAG
jgi:hypothetical protein